MSGILEVTNPTGTYFKLGTGQAENLKENELYKVEPDQRFEYSSIDMNVGKYGGHYKVHFDEVIANKYWPNGVRTWYVYPADVAV